MDFGDGNGGVMSKAEYLASMVGQQPTKEITVKVPNMCKNKGSGFKRFISQREKALNLANKRVQKCAKCKATTHDARKCLMNKNAVGASTSESSIAQDKAVVGSKN